MKQVTITLTQQDYDDLVVSLSIGVEDGNSRAIRLHRAVTLNPKFSEQFLPPDLTEAIAKCFDAGQDFVETVKDIKNVFGIPLMKAKARVEEFLLANERYHSHAPKWLLENK